jgi:hypothetical protein
MTMQAINAANRKSIVKQPVGTNHFQLRDHQPRRDGVGGAGDGDGVGVGGTDGGTGGGVDSISAF